MKNPVQFCSFVIQIQSPVIVIKRFKTGQCISSLQTMSFYEHHEVHTIFSALTQKYPLSKEHKGYFIMQVSFLKIYTPQVSPKLFTGVFLINKGSSITKGFIYLQVSFATKNGKRLGLSALYKGHFWKLKGQI